MNKLPGLTVQVISGDTGKIKDFVAFLESVGVQWQNASGYYPPYRFQDRVAYTVDCVSVPNCDPQPGPYDVVLGGKG